MKESETSGLFLLVKKKKRKLRAEEENQKRRKKKKRRMHPKRINLGVCLLACSLVCFFG